MSVSAKEDYLAAQASTTKPVVPGPKINILKLLFDRGGPEQYLQFLPQVALKYGGIARLKFVGQTVYLLDDADYIRYVLQTNNRNYKKSKNDEPIKMVVGEGLFTSEGSFWRRQRRLAQPAFHRRRISNLASLMTTETESSIKSWEGVAQRRSAPLDLSREMAKLTLRVVSKALLGADVEGQVEKIYNASTFQNKYINDRLWGLFHLPHQLPTPKNLRFKRALKDLDEVVYGIIEARRRTGEQKDDLLSMLLEARDEDTGEGMSQKQLRDEVMTLLLAGADTTANALTWTWHLLAEYPETERRLHEELDDVLGQRTPQFEDLQNLSYTRMVFEEALRLYPPGWIVTRQPIQDDVIGGYPIPAGSTLLISPYVTHRNPRYWKDPETFAPERFEEKRSKERPEFAYFPFGGGPRKCIGNTFAMTEGQLILATIGQHYKLRHVPGRPVQAEPVATLRPKHGLLMTLEER